jgi:hypothetical protein
MTTADLQTLLDRTMAGDVPHAEKVTVAAAVLSEVLRRRGMVATLVGGGAIELYAPETYATSDIDLVVEGRPRTEIDAALTAFGFDRSGRHWVRGDLFVEVPGTIMSDPVEELSAGGLRLRVVRREVVLADRVIGFKHWGATAYGAQAIALLAALGDVVDERMLRDRVRAEDAGDALDVLWTMARSGARVSEVDLRNVLDRLHGRKEGPGE